MDLIDAVEKSISIYDRRNDDTVGSDSIIIAVAIATCFQELVASIDKLTAEIQGIRADIASSENQQFMVDLYKG